MRQIALGFLCSALLATPALAQEPAKLNLRTHRALEGVSFYKPVVNPTLSMTPVAAQAAAADPKVTGLVGADFRLTRSTDREERFFMLHAARVVGGLPATGQSHGQTYYY